MGWQALYIQPPYSEWDMVQTGLPIQACSEMSSSLRLIVSLIGLFNIRYCGPKEFT